MARILMEDKIRKLEEEIAEVQLKLDDQKSSLKHYEVVVAELTGRLTESKAVLAKLEDAKAFLRGDLAKVVMLWEYQGIKKNIAAGKVKIQSYEDNIKASNKERLKISKKILDLQAKETTLQEALTKLKEVPPPEQLIEVDFVNKRRV